MFLAKILLCFRTIRFLLLSLHKIDGTAHCLSGFT